MVTHNSVTLSWRDPQDDSITGYVILRRDKAIHEEGIFQDVEDDTGSADTTYTDDTAEPNRQYVYRIKAINAAGLSEISSWVRAYTPAAPDGQPPAAPQQVISGAGHDSRTAPLARPPGRQHHRLPHSARRRRGRGAGRVRHHHPGHRQ